jgi:hypothetical protein
MYQSPPPRTPAESKPEALIMLTAFMRLASNRGHMILVSAVTVLLGLLLYLIFVLDHPFGPMGVTPQPFAHALTVFDLVDSGT